MSQIQLKQRGLERPGTGVTKKMGPQIQTESESADAPSLVGTKGLFNRSIER